LFFRFSILIFLYECDDVLRKQHQRPKNEARHKQDKKNAAFAQGAYIDVRNQAKTQVRRRIAQPRMQHQRPKNEARRKQDKARAAFLTGVYIGVHDRKKTQA
jgi:hypothetical protein